MIIFDAIGQGWQAVAAIDEGRTVHKGVGRLFVIACEGGDDVLVVGSEEWTGEPCRSGTQKTFVGSDDDWDVAHFFRQSLPS